MKFLSPLKLYSLSLILLIFGSCAAQGNLLNKVKEANKAKSQLNAPAASKSITEGEAAQALKDALDNGAKQTVDVVSKANGYLGNPEIKIPFPPDAKKVEDKLRSMGMGNKVDEGDINRAAEDAAAAAKPILVDAIKQLTVRDAINIVKGERCYDSILDTHYKSSNL